MKKFSFVFISVNVFALMFGIVLMPNLAIGQIAAWDFSGQNSPTTYPATTFSSNLISSSGANEITRGSTATPSSTANSFRTAGFKDDGISTSNTDYFQITLQAASSYKVSLSTIDAKFGGTSTFFASPGVTSQFAYSLDGTNFTLIGSPVQTTSLAMTQISLTGITNLQNVVSGTTITIRYYASGQTPTGGWGFLSAASLGTNGLAIGGSVVALPPPTQLVITNITPASPTLGSGFNVTVQAQEASGNPSNVVAATDFSFSTNGAAGSIGGTTTGTISAGSNSVTITGVTLSTIGTGATIIATRTGGDNLTTATSTPFNVLAAATHLAFVGVPSASATATNLTSFTVKALRPDNSIDDTYAGNIIVNKATGSGALTGTTTKAAVAGVATFDDLQFDAASIYTIHANSGSFSQITSNAITVTLPTNAMDYFRSNIASGNWGTNRSWDSSHDNITWITATLAPNSDANTTTIRNGHTIIIAATVTIDQVVVESGGILSYTGGTLTVNDDASGHDIIIQNGGVFLHNPSPASLPVFLSTASINIQEGGMIEALTSSGSAANYASDAASSAFQTSMVWDNGSIFKWNNSASPATSGRVFFPKVNATTIPILRINNGWGSVGGASPTTINGKIEANTAVSWGTSGGIKTFRNGIIGTGSMTQSTGGQWVINGATATLGGGVSLALGTAGLSINSTNITNTGTLTVTGGTSIVAGGTLQVSSNQSFNNLSLNGGSINVDNGVTLNVDGTLTLTSGKITLGTGNVIATAVSGGSSSSYVVTAGTGKLTINAVSSATLFPVGPTPSAYNPVTIANGGGSNYAVNVSSTAPTGSGITQPGAAIKRQWDITPSGTPSNVSLTFHYNDNEGVLGSFLPTGSMDGIHFNGTKWDYIGSAMGVVNSPYSVTFTYAGPTWSPFSFGNSGILPTELTDLKAKTQNGQNLITWQTATERNSNHFDIQRTTNPQAHWQTIGTVKAAGNSQTVKEYEYVDNAPLSISYYRLRQVDFDSKETLSNTVSVNFQGKQSDLTVFPTYSENRLTVIGNMDLTTNFEVANLLGQIVLRGRFNGSNDIDVQSLVSGVYILNVNNQTAKFFKK